MKKLLILNIVILVLVTGNYVLAEQAPPKKLSLKEAVDYARKNNYSLKNNQLEILAAEKKVNEVLSIGLPQVNAFGNFTNNTTIASNAINFGGQDVILKFGLPYVATGSLQASQLLFDGTFLMGVKASKVFVELSRMNLNRNEVEAEVAVTKAYYAALLFQTNVYLLDTNITAIEKTKNDLEKIYENGMLEKTDVDRVRLQLSNLVLQRERVINQHKVAMMLLQLQMGVNVEDSVVLTDNLPEMYRTTPVPVVPSKVEYDNRPEYRMLNQQLKLYTYEKKSYQLGYLPSLNAVAATQRNSFGQDFSNLGTTWYPGTYWGLNLSVPIFDGFRKSSKIQQSKISIQKTENDKKNLENAINQQVFSARNNFNLASQQVRIQQDNMRLAQDIYDRIDLKYRNGVGSSLDLTTAQNDLANSRQAFLVTIFEYFSAQIELRKAMGDIK